MMFRNAIRICFPIILGLSLASCASVSSPETVLVVPGGNAENIVPSSGRFYSEMPEGLFSLEENDTLQAVGMQLQPRMTMVTSSDEAEYIVQTSYARFPASLKVVSPAGQIDANASSIPKRRPFSCRRDIVEMSIVILRAATGERVFLGRAQQIVCQGNQYDVDRPALARAALGI
jgi:hypothetical protein